MTVGDILEWLAAALFVTAATLFGGLVLALTVAGICMTYFAQCLSDETVTVERRRKE